MDMYDPPVNLNKSEVIEIIMCDVCNGSTIAVGETDGEILLTEGGIVALMIDGADRLEVYLLLLNSFTNKSLRTEELRTVTISAASIVGRVHSLILKRQLDDSIGRSNQRELTV